MATLESHAVHEERFFGNTASHRMSASLPVPGGQNHLLILGERLVSFLAQQAADRLQRIFPEQEVIVSIVVPVHETGTMKQSVLLLLVDLIKQFRHQTEKPAKLLLASLRSGSLRFSHRLMA